LNGFFDDLFGEGFLDSPVSIVGPSHLREDLSSNCCGAPVIVCDDDICSKCGHPCGWSKVKKEKV
jgi:hypothetical protein